MVYHPILVRNIMHLTDARYFAAVGVDHMSLELDESQITFDRWHAIKNWIEGVSLIAEPANTDESLLAKIIIDAKPNGLVITPAMLPAIPSEMEMFMMEYNVMNPAFLPGVKLILDAESDLLESGFQFLHYEQPVYLQMNWNPLLLARVLQQGYTGGICFTGGKEEITGVRDYNLMDDMISLLRS
jgi:hypothetical protein